MLVSFATNPTSRQFVWPYLDDPTWRRRLPLPGRSDPDDAGDVPVVVPHPDGRLLAVGVYDSRPHPFARWPELVDWLDRHGLDLHPSPSHVVLIDAADGSEVDRLLHGPSPWTWYAPEVFDAQPAMAFSPDGRRLAVLGDDAIRIWDLPLRRSWGLILALAAGPPAAAGVVLLAARLLRRVRQA